MSEVSTSKQKAKASEFEMPKFEIPRFEMPKFEVPAAFREFAEKSVTQCKDGWEKMKAVTEEATSVIEESHATPAKGYPAYGLKLMEAARANSKASFDYVGKLIAVNAASGAVGLPPAHLRSQYE